MYSQEKDFTPDLCFKRQNMTIGARNRVMQNIYTLVKKHRSFLILGHETPDEDCFASTVAGALLLRKFNKHVSIFLECLPPENLKFLSSICKYNKINVYYGTMPPIRFVEVLCILDTPKPEMIAANGCIYNFLHDPTIPKVELDHHFGSDATYIGDPNYCLVLHASSTCEILCRICYKLANHPEIRQRYSIEELYSRNLVLTLLTGMLGDAKMGNYISNSHDKEVFDYFSKHLNLMLRISTHSEGHTKKIESMERLLDVMETTDAETEKVYNENKDNLSAVKNSPFASVYAFYNKTGTNDLVYTISSNSGGKAKLTVQNNSPFNVEIRVNSPEGEVLGYTGAYTANTVLNMNPGDYTLYPVFKKYIARDNEIYSVVPKFKTSKKPYSRGAISKTPISI